MTGRQRVPSAVVLILGMAVAGGCGRAAAPLSVSTSAPTAVTTVTTPSDAQVLSVPPSTGLPSSPETPTLAPRAKELIDMAKQARQDAVVLTISAVQGETEATAQALRDLGATVESTDATVGYIRASVPVDLAARAATLEGVSRADVEEPIGFPDPTP
ncbi:hypothetical protein [Umezawaea sp. NPDC059074]|uniref:hypothetical protein n=1 Tax=Umezawaea sp. NPDC059074 TaxID=3346716 RepID=UPI0036813170